MNEALQLGFAVFAGVGAALAARGAVVWVLRQSGLASSNAVIAQHEAREARAEAARAGLSAAKAAKRLEDFEELVDRVVKLEETVEVHDTKIKLSVG